MTASAPNGTTASKTGIFSTNISILRRHQLRRQHNWKRCGKSKENGREAYENGRGQTLCARSDERKLTHGGPRASIEFTPTNTALCTPRRPFHGGNSESRRVFDPAEEKAA